MALLKFVEQGSCSGSCSSCSATFHLQETMLIALQPSVHSRNTIDEEGQLLGVDQKAFYLPKKNTGYGDCSVGAFTNNYANGKRRRVCRDCRQTAQKISHCLVGFAFPKTLLDSFLWSPVLNCKTLGQL